MSHLHQTEKNAQHIGNPFFVLFKLSQGPRTEWRAILRGGGRLYNKYIGNELFILGGIISLPHTPFVSTSHVKSYFDRGRSQKAEFVTPKDGSLDGGFEAPGLLNNIQEANEY